MELHEQLYHPLSRGFPPVSYAVLGSHRDHRSRAMTFDFHELIAVCVTLASKCDFSMPRRCGRPSPQTGVRQLRQIPRCPSRQETLREVEQWDCVEIWVEHAKKLASRESQRRLVDFER